MESLSLSESTRPKKSAAVDKGKSLDARPADRAHTKKPAAEGELIVVSLYTNSDCDSTEQVFVM